MSELAIPTALSALRQQLTRVVEAGDLALPLRALQLRGLNETALVVHIERLRATNEATGGDEQVEENCLLALDIVNGALPDIGLQWDAQHEAAGLVPRALAPAQIDEALGFALTPSDLLPPRPAISALPAKLEEALHDEVAHIVASYAFLPVHGDTVRAPRGAFTTRPAALLSFLDRLILEGLTNYVEANLSQALPAEVLWPRRRHERPFAQVTDRVLEAESPYVAKADITNFFGSVQHGLLSVFLCTHLGVSSVVARALEATLGAVMGGAKGLPQGPICSDVLASAYLLPVDLQLKTERIDFVRYMDDYYFPVTSVAEGQQVLRRLEVLLLDLGLALNDAKTRLMRRATYTSGAGLGESVRRLKLALLEEHFDALDDIDNQTDASGLLEEAGVPEETMWDLLYHHSVDVEEVVADLLESVTPEFWQTYKLFFDGISRRLRVDGAPADPGATERLLHEALALLSLSDAKVAPRDLDVVQAWFPSTTPDVVRYLTSKPRRRTRWAKEVVETGIRDLSGFDWRDAWICFGAAELPRLNQTLRKALNDALDQEQAGPLTRLECVRALARHDALHERQWRQELERASPAISAELIFGATQTLASYPWLHDVFEGQPDTRLKQLAGRLQELAETAESAS
jgi:Reverse transcriptase (RNA-dependent DNA polymerase)